MIVDVPPLLLVSVKQYKNYLLKKKLSKPKLIHQLAIHTYRLQRHVLNIRSQHATERASLLPIILARHQSLLLKKLGNNNEHLQQQKVKNLLLASNQIDRIIIKPGQTFSYWHAIGRPQKKHGYVEGMLLSQSKVTAGIGGGLCQLSNLLYWLFLHGPFKILERYHHSYDVFPDSGRVLPFGSGATVFYNYVDLVVKNTSSSPIQIHVWLSGKHLKGQLLSSQSHERKFSVKEKNHLFVHWKNQWFRYNELYRETKYKGQVESTELITTNFAPVLYKTSKEELVARGHSIVELNNAIK